MIGFLPQIYDDELIYSWLARYHVRSGHESYIYTASDLYENKFIRPDAEFINGFRPDVIVLIEQHIMPLEKLVAAHTMFPAYGRFIPKPRRKEAFKSLVEMNNNHHNLMPIPKNPDGIPRHLRYCKQCAMEDRELYGETYWHRSHQIIGLDICPKHKSYLINSIVILSSKTSPSLYAADITIDETTEPLPCNNSIELKLGSYILDVFLSPVDMEADLSIGEFLHHNLDKEKYLSSSSALRKMSVLYDAYVSYYTDLGEDHIMNTTHMQKIFNGYRSSFHEICQLALFENIPPTKLVHTDMDDKELGNNKIFLQVAQQLNCDYDTVKLIGSEVLRLYQNSTHIQKRSGPQRKSWEKLDAELIPQVRQAVQELYVTDKNRPQRVSVASVCKKLSLPPKRFDLLPLCKQEIAKYMESQEQYWAREVAWVLQQLQESGTPLCWKRIQEATHMRRINLQSCLVYLKPLISEESYNEVCKLL